MKKAAMISALLVAILAASHSGGMSTASAFNPQPEPPAKAAVARWFVQMFPVSGVAERGRPVVAPIGAAAPQFNPGIEHEDIGA